LRNIYEDCRRDCAIILTHVDPLSHDALRATEKDVNIAQYRALTIPDALCATEKTVSFNTR